MKEFLPIWKASCHVHVEKQFETTKRINTTYLALPIITKYIFDAMRHKTPAHLCSIQALGQIVKETESILQRRRYTIIPYDHWVSKEQAHAVIDGAFDEITTLVDNLIEQEANQQDNTDAIRAA